ncbi:hypothetical protein GGS23DRAFT_591994 [Durotheca rogersii]|uniref:uncharacterized protein n=1 Tax=Durotheca rogersii TaxID=419775 RepID=UPI00222027C8|nr:uncharacterized protein GGS23DRAFT_591994 [Durotheca rogersii]KAI5868203.1 hypothetical protein GGS23DRAFT_591994 [Durotheca rogersii]
MQRLHRTNDMLNWDQREFLRVHFPTVNINHWKVRLVSESAGMRDSVVTTYATVPGKYVCFSIHTEDLVERVKARDILKVNYVADQWDLRTLALVIYYKIQNQDVRNAMVNAYNARTKEKGWGRWLEITPSDTEWGEASRNNPFVLGLQKLIAENPGLMRGASVGSIQFIILHNMVDPRAVLLHLKIRITR